MTNNKLPWCSTCKCYSVPENNGKCGNCGTEITYKDNEQA